MTSAKLFYYFFAALAAVGLALSGWSHGAATLGKPGPLGNSAWLLHVGIFVVWLPAALIAPRLTRAVDPKDFWSATFHGCPRWLRYALKGLTVYAVLNLLLVFYVLPPREEVFRIPITPHAVRGFSGYWMLFYGAAMVLLVSAARLKERRCPKGHLVGPLAQTCEKCGYLWNS